MFVALDGEVFASLVDWGGVCRGVCQVVVLSLCQDCELWMVMIDVVGVWENMRLRWLEVGMDGVVVV